MDRQQVFLSLVIPVFNEEQTLPLLFARIDSALAGPLRDLGTIEVVLVDDGSADRSWELIAARCRQDARCTGVRLSRNFGQQAALTAGLEAARGEAVVSLDADLQDPPELIPEMVAMYRKGYDVVYGTRRSRGTEPWLKRVTATGFYTLMERISGVRIARATGDFRLMSRRALTHLASLRETHRFLRGLVPWIGLAQTRVLYDRGDRIAGATHFPLHKMMMLAFDGIASMSVAPLRLAFLMSVLLFAVCVGYIGVTVVKFFVFGVPMVPGWTSLMATVTIFGTIQLLLLGIFGEYIGRIYEQVKQRPIYLVSEVISGGKVDEAPTGTRGDPPARG